MHYKVKTIFAFRNQIILEVKKYKIMGALLLTTTYVKDYLISECITLKGYHLKFISLFILLFSTFDTSS